MEKISPTAARIIKKSLWKDIQRWVNEDYASGTIEIDTCSKKKILSRALDLTKKKDGDFYAGAILVEVSRFPSKNSLIVLTWDNYIDSKRLAIIPIMYDKNLEENPRRGISLTEHAIERMAGRLNTLNRIQIIHELTAAAMPSCFLLMNFLTPPKHGDFFAVKTPHGIGVLAVDHHEDINFAGYLVTWISDEDATAPKFRHIEWTAIPRRTKGDTSIVTVDIPAGAKMYLPHALTKEWALSVIGKY